MKKLFFILVAVIGLTTAASAQENTFGLRAGFGAAFSPELSYQRFVGDINRLELDLGMRFRRNITRNTGDDATKILYPGGPTLTAIYQWHWFLAGGFGVYGGPGVQLSIPAWHHFGLGLGGQIGFDYQFDAPFQIALDFRPIYNVIGQFKGVKEDGKVRIGGGFDPSVGVSLRYAF